MKDEKPRTVTPPSRGWRARRVVPVGLCSLCPRSPDLAAPPPQRHRGAPPTSVSREESFLESAIRPIGPALRRRDARGDFARSRRGGTRAAGFSTDPRGCDVPSPRARRGLFPLWRRSRTTWRLRVTAARKGPTQRRTRPQGTVLRSLHVSAARRDRCSGVFVVLRAPAPGRSFAFASEPIGCGKPLRVRNPRRCLATTGMRKRKCFADPLGPAGMTREGLRASHRPGGSRSKRCRSFGSHADSGRRQEKGACSKGCARASRHDASRRLFAPCSIALVLVVKSRGRPVRTPALPQAACSKPPPRR